jgi:hypothetical protein
VFGWLGTGFTYAVQALATVIAFTIVHQVASLGFAVVMATLTRGNVVRWPSILLNAATTYLLASTLAIGALAWVSAESSLLRLAGLSVINFLAVLFTLQRSIRDRRKQAHQDGVDPDQSGTYWFDVGFSWIGAALSVAGIFIPALGLNPVSVLVVGAVLWVLAIPVVSWVIDWFAGMAVLGGLFMVLIVCGVGVYALVGRVRAWRAAA